MTTLTPIGNSQGIRIPKPLIKQAQLENVQLELIVIDRGLLIRPVKQSRSTWSQNIDQVMLTNKSIKDEAILDDLLNDNDLEEWEW
ncbi:AbrB/MazE/SpoVT family DNA-binding domain-containing protein [bacterium]|nr:AbrB/MazE/SpoVT family DNA-binding domain-containing protein [bacterium]MBU1957008.1 AbrB/MazE/SpoVT family DNA-binding domain-containing protein [bacterium]